MSSLLLVLIQVNPGVGHTTDFNGQFATEERVPHWCAKSSAVPRALPFPDEEWFEPQQASPLAYGDTHTGSPSLCAGSSGFEITTESDHDNHNVSYISLAGYIYIYLLACQYFPFFGLHALCSV